MTTIVLQKTNVSSRAFDSTYQSIDDGQRISKSVTIVLIWKKNVSREKPKSERERKKERNEFFLLTTIIMNPLTLLRFTDSLSFLLLGFWFAMVTKSNYKLDHRHHFVFILSVDEYTKKNLNVIIRQSSWLNHGKVNLI